MPIRLEDFPCSRSHWEISMGCHTGYSDCKDLVCCPGMVGIY